MPTTLPFDITPNLLNPFTPVRLCLAACVYLCLALSVRFAALWDHTQNVQDVHHKEGGDIMPGGAMPSQLCRLLVVLDRLSGVNLALLGNPWAEPPESIVAKGPKSIRGYFEDLYAEPCWIKRSSVKVVLVGQEGAGKTSLRQSMKANKATPTGEWKEESTVFADVEPMELEGSSVRVYDCAGQVAYTGLLQMFLTPRSVCVLVCNAGEFGQQLGSDNVDQVEEDCRKLQALRVCDWLRSISRRVPGNDVILVATKCDLVSGNAEETGRRLEHACRMWLSTWVRNGMDPVRLEPHVSLTSCFPIGDGEHGESNTGSDASKQGWACDWRHVEGDKSSPSLLYRLVNKPDEGGLRGVQMVLPRSWDIALTVLEALEHGRDPVEMVLLKSPDSERRPTETGVGKTNVYQAIKVEELGTNWRETVDELGKRGIVVTNAENALEGALSIREFDGSLVRHEKFVFLDVVWLARILKPLLNHKDQRTFDGRVNLGDTGDARITLDDSSDIASWGRLKNEGVLEPRLAYAMWPDGLSEYVLPTLASLGLTFPLEGDPDNGLVVLLRLEPNRPASVGEAIDTFCSKYTPAFSASWEIFLGVPPGAIEKVLTRCCGLGDVQTFWRYGVLVHGGLGDLDGRGIFAVVTEYSSTNNELTAQIFGDISTSAPWVALSYVTSAVSLMLMDFPGLRWNGSLKCPQHGYEMPFATKVNCAGDKFLERRCPRCSPQTRGLGAAAIDLIRMVDIRLDRGVIDREVKARFDVLESQYFTCPAGSSTDEDEFVRKMDEVKAELKDTKTELRDVKDRLGMIAGRLDKVLESTQESLARLKNLQAPNYHYPRLVVVKEVGSHGTSSKAHGKKSMLSKLRGLGKKDMRLHFLCPVDMTTVPCGYGGEGYQFQETRAWVKRVSPALQVTVVTAKVALNAVTGLNVDISDFLKDVKDGLVEELVDRTLDEDALLRAVSGDDTVGADLQRDTRASYEALKVFMENEERRRRKNARDGDGYIEFREEMKRLPDGRGGEVWVRNENVRKWLASNSSPAPSR
ncbi:LRR-GTPase of the ROCO family, incomplete sequence [Ectocarpus siliculosus]|uniref:LRR-GTPase of the ROCO family, incomplete sequence n=1 Tax=Ectocarpus siliculosus TaxID=2880 RepID=D7FZA1_ECTSI|nr:LRR-GTPase of the ROCO family, incomplete sequence [Ectocarpus siliculosus]|eukprot:CBJ32718.1 LRR-GTPase of the ROCO family, incomplete sequence [Ectocarpus siliculosus]